MRYKRASVIRGKRKEVPGMLAAVIPGDSNTVLEVLGHAAGDLAVRCRQRYSESLQVRFTDSGAPVPLLTGSTSGRAQQSPDIHVESNGLTILLECGRRR